MFKVIKYICPGMLLSFEHLILIVTVVLVYICCSRKCNLVKFEILPTETEIVVIGRE